VIEEKLFLRTRSGDESFGFEKEKRRRLRAVIIVILTAALLAGAWKAYDILWLRHRYLITAYCDCPICINVKSFRNGKFASRKPVYWGGIAADKKIPFRSGVELVPATPTDWFAVWRLLDGRRKFVVEDRGGKIRVRHLDIFFPKDRGGHEAALRWGARRMRIKINGKLAD